MSWQEEGRKLAEKAIPRSSPARASDTGRSTNQDTSCAAASDFDAMACTDPIDGYRPAIGGPISFSRPNGQAGVDYYKLTLPCGYCILCRSEQARQTAIRITHEASLHNESSFVTLTYDAKHLPEHNSLKYEDLQKFWKRLRKHFGKLRYYAVGEYGDRTLRPHYHACIFGHAFTADRILLRRLPTLLWTSPKLANTWGLGNVSVGALTFETARYTASYVTKKLRRKQQYVRVDEQTGELIALEQPRAFMSRNIAKDWWLQNQHQVTTHDYVIINNKRQKPPRAYDRWLKEKSELAEELTKLTRYERSKPLTPDQIRARARYAHAHAESVSKTF